MESVLTHLLSHKIPDNLHDGDQPSVLDERSISALEEACNGDLSGKVALQTMLLTCHVLLL